MHSYLYIYLPACTLRSVRQCSFCGTIVIKGGNLRFEYIKTIHSINYRIRLSYLYYPAVHLQFAKMRAFSLHSLVLICSTDFRRYSNLFHFQTNIYNGFVFENATHFAFLIKLLKNPFHTDQWMLLKHLYRLGRAVNHQSNTDMENYENRPLNKPITVMMNQHT